MWGCGAIDFISLPSNPVIRSFNFDLWQGFTHALLSTAFFPQKFSFFTACLVLSLYLGFQLADKYISDTISDCRSQNCLERHQFITEVRVFSGVSKKSWLGESSWRDWVSQLNTRLTFYCCLPVVEKCLEKCLLWV